MCQTPHMAIAEEDAVQAGRARAGAAESSACVAFGEAARGRRQHCPARVVPVAVRPGACTCTRYKTVGDDTMLLSPGSEFSLCGIMKLPYFATNAFDQGSSSTYEPRMIVFSILPVALYLRP